MDAFGITLGNHAFTSSLTWIILGSDLETLTFRVSVVNN